jgi:hypothetical protein
LYKAEGQLRNKEVENLEEKISKMDMQLQNTVREKNSLQATVTSKDLEISNLLKMQTTLKLNVSSFL